MRVIFALVSSMILFVACCMPLIAQDAADTESKNAAAPGKITVAAERMEMLLGEVIKLDGDVMVEDNRYTLTCEHGMIYLKQKDDAQSDATKEKADDGLNNNAVLDRIEATGRVMVRTHDGKQSATGDRARYERESERITLDGDCTILSEGRVMRCARVIYDVKAGTITASRTSITIPLGNSGGEDKDAFGGLFGGNKNSDSKKTENEAGEKIDK